MVACREDCFDAIAARVMEERGRMIRLTGDNRELERRRTGPVLGAHLGKGCIGVAYIE